MPGGHKVMPGNHTSPPDLGRNFLLLPVTEQPR